MNCKDCLPLIPGYLDGELSETQAAPLRQHLMDCRVCRKALSGEKALKRWFEADAEAGVEVLPPPGFAARVARRAFAGDTGESVVVGSPVPSEAPILQFALRATAAAAALLLVLSAWLRNVGLPDGGNVAADHRPRSLQETLDELNELEAPSVQATATPEETSSPTDALSEEREGGER